MGPGLMEHDDIVRRVISLFDFLDATQHREIEMELRAHVEDVMEEARAQGYDEAAIARIVEARFGSPREVADGFRTAYARERPILNVVGAASLLLASLVAVGLVVGSVQSIFAICTAASLRSAFNQVAWESIGFAAIALGYCSLYFGERLLRTSLTKQILLGAALVFCLAFGLSKAGSEHSALPLVGFASAAMARLLQRIRIPFVWLAGTAGPLFAAGMIPRFLSSGHEQGLHPQFLWLVWLGLTLCCQALQLIVQCFEKHLFAWKVDART
jgi:hypothetical protein